MKLGDFAEAISTRIWESVGRANWRKFEDARAFVRSLGLKSGEPNGASIVSQARSPPTFRLIPYTSTQRPAGPDWATGWGLASPRRLAAFQGSPHFRAPSRFEI